MLTDDIIHLIEEGINDQHELLRQLKILGHELTQSSISRKLKQLGISKMHGRYQRAQLMMNKEREISFVFVAPNLLVIRTFPGHAGVVAAKIDQQLVENPQYPEVIGSIAGDDTIFVAVNISNRDSAPLIEKIKEAIKL